MAPAVPSAADAARLAARAADRRRALLAAILVATFALYAPSLGNDFTWDDRHAAMGSGPNRQPLVAELCSPAAYFASNWWPQHAPAATAYRPLTTAWFALRHACCGDHALVAHLLNVALHTLAVALAYRLLRALGAPFGAAAAATAVFGLHAVHSEAVANVVGAAELLALTGGLAGTLALLRAADAGSGRRVAGWLAVAAACWFAAAAAKEHGLGWVVFAPACAVARGWLGGGAPLTRARALGAAGAAAAVAVVYLALRHGMLARLPAGGDTTNGLLDNPLLALPPVQRAASGVLGWAHGLQQVLLPRALCCDHGPDQLPVVRELASVAGGCSALVAVAFAAALVAAARCARRQPLLALGAACFAGFSFPLTNVPMPVYMHFAERSYVTPSFGLALAVAAGAASLRTPRARRLALVGLAAWLVHSVATAWPRNFVWADDATLVEREVASSPRSVRLQLCAGVLRRQRGDFAAAERHFRIASELAPDLPQPWLELAANAWQRGDAGAARDHLARAERGHPLEVARYAAALRGARAAVDAGRPAAAPR